MFRSFFYFLLTLAFLAGGGWWLYHNNLDIQQKVESYLPLEARAFQTLEMRYTADNIMENNKKSLLKDGQYQFLAPSLQFYPYLLLEVKYSKESQTKEGMMLWGLGDGEMVIHTGTWERSHGFKDCITAGAKREELQVLMALAKGGGSFDRASLLQQLRLEEDHLDQILALCRKKKLIVQTGNAYRLHFDRPRISIMPETIIDQPLVTKTLKGEATCIPKVFSASQIKALSQDTFGADFAIRSEKEVFLPVHRIVVENPDGSLFTSYWNALNGKRMNAFALK